MKQFTTLIDDGFIWNKGRGSMRSTKRQSKNRGASHLFKISVRYRLTLNSAEDAVNPADAAERMAGPLPPSIERR